MFLFGAGAASMRSQGPCHVYVVGSLGRRNRCKTGETTRAPQERLLQLQTGNPEPLYLHSVMASKAPSALERRAHSALTQHRILGVARPLASAPRAQL